MTRRKPQTTEETTVPINSKRDIISQVIKKRNKGKFLTDNQKIYSETLLNNQITICSGPAGDGKS
jgi:phosphate starvation-inducible protein PhoH